MEANRTCRECGVIVAKDAPFGHCPRCLIELGFFQGKPTEDEENPRWAKNFKFGDYEIIQEISRGGMGVVYRARQVSLNRVVAIKMVIDSYLSSPLAVKRFLAEAEAAAKLQHPNIVRVHDVGEVEAQHFFSMDFIGGESLEESINRGKFRVPKDGKRLKVSRDDVQVKTATLMAVVARAVHYAHERGVLHRDLKPSNILMDESDQPYLTDFGLAKMMDNQGSLTLSGALSGTPGYMSPEQINAKPCTRATDVFGLGGILYKLLTGRVAFEGATPVEAMRRAKDEEPTHPIKVNGNIDADLATICLKCLEKEPLQRYASAAAVAEDLERWIRREPIEAKPVRWPGRFWRWCQREPVVATMTLGLITLAIAIAALTSVLYQRERKSRQLLEARSAQELRALMDRIERDRDRGEVLTRAKDSARRVECFNNQRQWLLALQSHVDDNDDYLPREGSRRDGRVRRDNWANVSDPLSRDVWYNMLPRQLGHKAARDYASALSGARAEFYRLRLFHCPSAKFPPFAATDNDAYFSLVMNSKLIQEPVEEPSASIRFASIVRPSDTVAFLEARVSEGERKVHVFQLNTDLGQPAAFATRFAARHKSGGNIAFADGHVSWNTGSAIVETRPGLSSGLAIFPGEILWRPDPLDDPNTLD